MITEQVYLIGVISAMLLFVAVLGVTAWISR